MMSGRDFGGRLAVLSALALAGMSLPAVAADTRAVLELFTSQGCNSCPPADKLVGELSKDPALIPLTLAIDYWDYLGWKDTLALAGHSSRQRAYSKVRGDRDVFTPQMVVNGAAQARGSDRADIERAIGQTRKNAAVLSVPLTLAVADGKFTVSAPAGKTGNERGEVWLCPITRAVPVEITRGENKGRTITYHNVVRRWVKLGDWNGTAGTWSVPLSDFKTGGVDHVAVVVQSGAASAPNAMYAAAQMPLP
jgi:hypothetical protein